MEVFGTQVKNYASHNASLHNFIIGKAKNVNLNAPNGSCLIKSVKIARIYAMKLKNLTPQPKNANQIVPNGSCIVKQPKNAKIYAVKCKTLIRQPKNAITNVMLLSNGITLHKNVFVVKDYFL